MSSILEKIWPSRAYSCGHLMTIPHSEWRSDQTVLICVIFSEYTGIIPLLTKTTLETSLLPGRYKVFTRRTKPSRCDPAAGNRTLLWNEHKETKVFLHSLSQWTAVHRFCLSNQAWFLHVLSKSHTLQACLPFANDPRSSDGSAGKEPTCNEGDLGSIPGLGSSPREGKGYPLQYSGLDNSMDCIVHGVERIRHDWVTFTCSFKCFWARPHSVPTVFPQTVGLITTRPFLCDIFSQFLLEYLLSSSLSNHVHISPTALADCTEITCLHQFLPIRAEVRKGQWLGIFFVLILKA